MNGFQLSEALNDLLQENNPALLGKAARVGRAPTSQIDSAVLQVAPSLPLENGQLVKALLLLWHDYLDASHLLSQEIKSPSGSLVHGMMHRREGDFWNAKYWFNRAGNHPIYALYEAAMRQEAEFGLIPAAWQKALSRRWDPAFVTDETEKAVTSPGGPPFKALQKIQWIETRALVQFLLLPA